MIRRLMQKIRGLVALLAVSVCGLEAATLGSAEPVAWRYAHPEAQILAGVNFLKLAETLEGRQIRAQFVSALGAPLMEHAERLFMSSVVDSSGRRSDVFILSGSFSLAQLRKMTMADGARITPYKGLEIAAPPGTAAGDPHLAWHTGPGGGTTVLIGTRPAIQAAGERGRAQIESMASINDLFARAHEMAPQYPIWVACENLPRGMGPRGLDNLEIDGFDVGVQTAKGSELSLWFWTENKATATDVLRQMQSSAAGKEPFLLSPWLPQMRSGIEEGTLVMSTPLVGSSSPAWLGSFLAAFALPVDGKPVPASALGVEVRAKAPDAPKVSAPVPAPAAPKKLFVRIEGLDEGAKDIPYTPNQ